jgi:hypothetical protein
VTKKTPFMIQICCLTVAPAFLAAGIYLTLSRIVMTFGVENSRIPAKWYPRIFIPCDILALILQSAGGGIASTADDDRDAADLGKNLMIAGLSAQVVTIFIFISLATDFAVRTYRRSRTLGADAFEMRHERLRASLSFRGFLAALATATILIFARSAYRVAELSDGWNGALMSDEPLFIGLEGVLIAAACLALNAFHPGFCFRGGYEKAEVLEMKGSGDSGDSRPTSNSQLWNRN